MASRKTWLWIIFGIVGVCLLALFAVAGAGIYFVTNHIDAKRVTVADAQKSFDGVLAEFKDSRPLFEIDSSERARAARPVADLPTSSTKPGQLWILAYGPDRERLMRVSIPFWLLRLGGHNLDLGSDDRFDLNRLNLDVRELERIGPALVLDYRARAGEHVLIWTR